MTAVYLRSPRGFVLDIDPDLGGEPERYIRAGWGIIPKDVFVVERERQYAAQAAMRAVWIQEMEGEAAGFGDFASARMRRALEQAPAVEALTGDA